MSAPLFYEVCAQFSDSATAAGWARWLEEEHLAEVIACGAQSGRLVVLDGEPKTLLAQYVFASREAFDRYVSEHAPRLRADGLRRFPATAVTYSRRTGDILMQR